MGNKWILAAVAARVAHAVVDICTVLTIATEAIGTVSAHEPFKWRRNICACHTLEARLVVATIFIATTAAVVTTDISASSWVSIVTCRAIGEANAIF